MRNRQRDILTHLGARAWSDIWHHKPVRSLHYCRSVWYKGKGTAWSAWTSNNLRKHVVEMRSFATIHTPHLDRRSIVLQICNLCCTNVVRTYWVCTSAERLHERIEVAQCRGVCTNAAMQHGQRIERGKRTDSLFIRIYMSWRYHTLLKPAASTRSTSTTNNSGGLLVPRKRRFLLCMSWDLRVTGAACFLISRSANWFFFSKEYTSTLTWVYSSKDTLVVLGSLQTLRRFWSHWQERNL